MTVMSQTDELVRQWRDEQIELNAGASDSDIAALEYVLGVPLPDEFQRLYSTVDGMVGCDFDQHMVSFWSIERILREAEIGAGTDDHGGYFDVAFADWLISSWFFWLRVRNGGSVTIYIESSGEEIGSFMAFLERYLRYPESFYV